MSLNKILYTLSMIGFTAAIIQLFKAGHPGWAWVVIITVLISHFMIGILAMLHQGSLADDMHEEYFRQNKS